MVQISLQKLLWHKPFFFNTCEIDNWWKNREKNVQMKNEKSVSTFKWKMKIFYFDFRDDFHGKAPEDPLLFAYYYTVIRNSHILYLFDCGIFREIVNTYAIFTKGDNLWTSRHTNWSLPHCNEIYSVLENNLQVRHVIWKLFFMLKTLSNTEISRQTAACKIMPKWTDNFVGKFLSISSTD